MLPSKMSPTISALRLITGDPEFPPVISGVDTKFTGVDKSSFSRPAVYRGGSANGPLESKLKERSYKP